MNSNKKVACPLDCYDACQGENNDGIIKGSNEDITNKKLCVNFASLLKEDNLKSAKYKNEDISLEKALDILEEKLKSTEAEKSIYYNGSGNLGLMQSAPKNFFTQYGSALTKGSLCDGGGGAGIEASRGAVINPSIDKLLDADVIIVWGRNFSVTSSHLYNQVKDKTFITIDPITTPIAKKSELHMKVNPKTDYELALFLTRLAFMNRAEDEEFLEEYTEGSDWFFDIAKNRPLVSYEATTGVSLDEAYKLFDMVEGKSVAIMLGLGVQKYLEGSQITRCIDGFAAYMGYHNPNTAGGLWYLSDSGYGYDKQFAIKGKNKKIAVPEVDFGNYELSFIQGANPVVSAPNTQTVIDGLKKSFVVFFGTTYNDTCEYADLIIPSCSFLSKKDVRLSYGNRHKSLSYIQKDKKEGTISEYELASYLIEKFDYQALCSEDEAFEYYKDKEVEYPTLEIFEFIEDIEVEPLYKDKTEDNFYLITAKSKSSLNSQFKVDNNVYLHESTGYSNGDIVKISSKYGEAQFTVSLSNDIKESCAFFFAGNKNTNYLTPNKEDEDSNSAMFQEVLINIELS